MATNPGRILVLDDDEGILLTVRILLRKYFSEIVIENTPEKIAYLLSQKHFHVIILDMNFSVGATSGKEGFFWLKTIREISPESRVIMMTAYGDIDLAIRAIKEGATDFVIKPWDNDKLISTVIAAYKQSQMTNVEEFLAPSTLDDIPTEEVERIFMFLDIKSSTEIAEKLGHVKYFELLKDFFTDISDSIVKYGGDIYQYVGDEVVISWALNKGIAHANCINCFFHISDTIDNLAATYMEKFNLKPQFKAGLHYGKVTTGSVGTVKKEVVFSGEVLNITSRIEGLCNRFRANMLVSEDLLKLLPLDGSLVTKEIGSINLRGKHKAMVLYDIHRVRQT